MQNKNKKAKRNFRKRLTGVRFKFVGLTTALVVVLLALLNSYPVQSSRDMVFSEKQTAMTNQAGTAASSLASLDHLSRESIAEVLNLLELDNYERVLVTNEKARVLYDTAAEKNQTGQQAEMKEISRAMEGKTSFYSRFTSEAFFSHVAVPILRDAKVIGAVYLDEKDEEQAGIITGIQSRIRTISAFICILALLADILAEGAVSAADPAAYSRTLPALRMIESRYPEKITLEQMAQACGMSTSAFRRAFAAVYEQPPLAYLLQFRVEKARELLLLGFSVEETAQRTGFSDANYFVRYFRTVTGMTPGRFRRMN